MKTKVLNLLLVLLVLGSSAFAQGRDFKRFLKNNPDGSQVLLNHVPFEVAHGLASRKAQANGNRLLDLRIVLPSKDQAGLDQFIKDIYDPRSPNYHKFLTPQQFIEQFGASEVDSSLVMEHLKSLGFIVNKRSRNRFVLSVQASVFTVQSVFKLNINTYQRGDGSTFFAPDANPTVSPKIADKVVEIIGLDNAVTFRPHYHRKAETPAATPVATTSVAKIAIRGPGGVILTAPSSSPFSSTAFLAPTAFLGKNGNMGPTDVKNIYNLNSIASTGTGQTLGLFELDGYSSSDITAFTTNYSTYFGASYVPNLTNVCTDVVDISSNPICPEAAGASTDEDVLDIDFALSVAPQINIIVYEAPNSLSGWVDQWNKIAGDDQASVISDSWGGEESGAFPFYDHAVFGQMAAQGQTVLASSGDSGAYDNCDHGTLPPSCTVDNSPAAGELSVDDPASDPYITGVGISVASPANLGLSSETYGSETASLYGGGGISSDWVISNTSPTPPAPAYNYQVTPATNYYNGTGHAFGSTTMRNVPDVSLTADPATSYEISLSGSWFPYWGSSISTPIWAAFISMANQARIAAGQSAIGFFNPILYHIAQSSRYANDLHDITTGTNSYFPAASGYDPATGLGSLNGANLYSDLIGPTPPSGLTPTPSNGEIVLNWSASSGTSYYNVKRATITGGPYTTISTAGVVTGLSYTDSSVVAGTPYFYVVSADNAVDIEGANSSQVTSTAFTTPGITTQPTNQTVNAPATATFGIVATGIPAPTYQWQKSTDGGSTWTPIAGATNASYTTPATAVSDSGTKFECVATNTAGSVTSNAATLTVDAVPALTAQPTDQTVLAPATATFTVVATGTPAPTYQWQKSTDSGATWTPIGSATNASYTTPATAVSDNGTEFECVITNTAGTATSNPATLVVSAVPIAPAIMTQPLNQTVNAPATATFTIVATGTPTPTYQWQKSTDSGATWTPIAGATNASYTTPATSGTDNGAEFECVATNMAGSATSNAATLTVNVGPAVTLQPVDQAVTSPATATFSITATGTPAPTYQWQKSTNGGSSWTPIAGATNNSYTTAATSSPDNGTKFECVATNTAGSVTSSAATLTVNTAPAIATQPSNQTVVAPAAATFSVVVTGTPTPTYQWQKSTDSGSTWTPVAGATNASYTTPATALGDSGTEFQCVVTNTAGSATSNAATLTVHTSPSVTAQPGNQTVNAPATATFTVTATGTPAPGYQWQQSTNSGSTWSTIAGATSNSYTTPATSFANNGTQFECVITNTAGTVTSNAATLTVDVQPVITVQPANQTVSAPAAATFSLTATGNPTPTYQWQESLDNGSSWTPIGGATNASYTTPATSVANSGIQYQCVVTNSLASVNSNAAILTVNAVPSITSQPSNQTVNAPAAATFSLTASGTPAPGYQWQKSTNGGSSWTTIAGATNNSYTTPATSAADNGTKFECVATNTAGTVTSNAVTLTVDVAPSITTQSTSQTVVAPATATFSVSAAGNPAPTYQWQKSTDSGSTWTPMGGATGTSYTTPATSVADSGTQFECVVTNTLGSATTTAMLLTVNAVPAITTQPANQAVTAPAAATFTVMATGTPAPGYQWQQSTNGGSSWTAIGGATSASYTTPATASIDNGTEFRCVITNSAGTVTSNAVTLEVDFPPSITLQPINQAVFTSQTATFTIATLGNPAVAYQWQKSTDSGSTWAPLTGATSTSYTTPVTTLTDNGSEYECQVSNGLGNVTSNAVTLTVTNPPIGAPGALSATILGARIGGQIIHDGASLVWVQSTTSGIIQNKIYRSAAGGSFSLVATISAGTSYIDTQLTRGTVYSYQVTAVNSSQIESVPSNTSTITY